MSVIKEKCDELKPSSGAIHYLHHAQKNEKPENG
jgi:hypothetical protein